MSYCTIGQVNKILANALTTGTSSDANGSPIPLIQFGTTRKTNLIDDDTVYQYIVWASSEIDSALNEMYEVPFCEKVDLELELVNDIDEYNQNISLDKAINLNPGDVLVFIDGTQEERHEINEVINNYDITLVSSLLGPFDSSSTRVLRLKFPDAINLICSRLSAANIYDKYFASQQDPNESEFGNKLRSLAVRDLNNILNGRTILHGQKRIGNRFYNSNLVDRYSLPSGDNDSSKNIEDI